MGIFYLRFLIGGLNVVFVVIVACVTLALALTISFKSLRDNADTAVSRLGAVTGKNVDDFFAMPQRHVDGVGSANARSDGFGGLPSEAPTFNGTGTPFSGGGELLQFYRTIMTTVMLEVQYRYVSLFCVFVDGTYLWQAPTFAAQLNMMVAVSIATWPTGPAATQQHPLVYSGHLLPSGAQHPRVTMMFGAVLPALNLVTDLRIPQYRAVVEGLYTNGTRSGTSRVAWGEIIFVSVRGRENFLVPLTRAITNSSGFLLGYAQLMLRTNDVSALLAEGQLTPSTRLVIYDIDGHLFGASSGVRIFDATNFTGPTTTPGCAATDSSRGVFPSDVSKRACRFHIRDAPIPVVRAAVRKDEAFFMQGTTAGAVRLVGSQYVYVQKLATLEGARAFTIAMVVPEGDMIGDAAKILPICAGVTAGVVVLVAAVSLLLVWLVLRPLQGIAERMGKAARLEPDDEEVSVSSLVEIGDLQRAFLEMRDELSRIRAFVPQSLLHANDDDSDDEADLIESSQANYALVTPSDIHSTPGAGPQLQPVESIGSTPDGARAIRVTRGGRAKSITGASRVSKPLGTSRRDSLSGTVHSHSTSAHSKPKAKLQLSAGVKKENVSVLSLNLRGFHGAAQDGLGVERVAATVEAVLRIAQQEKGVVDSFHGDRFLISFNAVKPAANHGIRAVVVAARVADAFSKVKDSGAGAYRLPISAGVATGPAQVGNLGSSEMKRFSIVGPVVSQAACLERLCKLYPEAVCLVPQRLFADLRTAVLVKTVDYVRLPFAQRPMLIGAVLRELSQAADDEWMYQLQQAGGVEGGADADDGDFTPGSMAHVLQNNAVWEALAERRADAGSLFDAFEAKADGCVSQRLKYSAIGATVPAESPGAVFSSDHPKAAVPSGLSPRELGDFYNEAFLGPDAVQAV